MDGLSAVVTAVFNWSDAGWEGIARKDLVVYELHIWPFTPEGTFVAVIPRLPELVSLGVTAIDLRRSSSSPAAGTGGTSASTSTPRRTHTAAARA